MSLSGFILAILSLTRIRAEFSPVVLNSCLVLSLYSSAGLGFLQQASIVFWILGCILLISILGYSRYRESIKSFSYKGLLAYLALLSVAYLLLIKRSLTAWDDFSHWALVSKDLINANKLAGENSIVVFKDYPPGGALYSYFVLNIENLISRPKFHGAMNEGLALFAQAVLVISCLFPLMAFAYTKLKLLKTLIVMLILLISVFSFGFNFNTLMIDIVVGSYFALGFIIYLKVKEDGLRSLWILAPILMVLVLLKKVGLFLSLILIMYFGVDQLLSLRWVKGDKLKQLISRIIFIAILLISVIACNYSWKLHVQSINGSQTFSTNIPISELERSFFGSSTEKEKIIKRNFLDQLKPIRVGSIDRAWIEFKIQKIATLALALIICSILIALKHLKESSYQRLMLFVVLFIGFIFYLFGLLILYYFSFGEYEAVRLASFDRYVAIYLFAWFVVLSADYILISSSNISYRKMAVVILMLLFLGYTGIKQFLKPSTYVSDFQRQITKQVNNEKIKISSDTKFYYLSQCDAGLKYLVFRYFIYPAKVAAGPYAIGPECFQGDVWTQNISVEKFKELLLDHVDYLVLDHPNEAFWQIYGSNFRDLKKDQEMQIIPIQELKLK